jgi:hypothetical protein
MKFLLMDGKNTRQITPNLAEFSRDIPSRLMFANIGVESSRRPDFSMDERLRAGRPRIELFGAIMSLLSDEPFLSARILAVRLSSTHQTIKRVLVNDLGMRKFVRRWILHDLSEVNRREQVLKADLLLEELRADERNEFANIMTGDGSWFCLSSESDSMFATLTFNFRSGHF